MGGTRQMALCASLPKCSVTPSLLVYTPSGVRCCFVKQRSSPTPEARQNPADGLFPRTILPQHLFLWRWEGGPLSPELHSPGPLCCLPAGRLAGDFQLAGFQLLELSGQRPELGKPEALFGTAGELRGVPRESLLPGILSRAGRGATLLFPAM